MDRMRETVLTNFRLAEAEKEFQAKMLKLFPERRKDGASAPRVGGFAKMAVSDLRRMGQYILDTEKASLLLTVVDRALFNGYITLTELEVTQTQWDLWCSECNYYSKYAKHALPEIFEKQNKNNVCRLKVDSNEVEGDILVDFFTTINERGEPIVYFFAYLEQDRIHELSLVSAKMVYDEKKGIRRMIKDFVIMGYPSFIARIKLLNETKTGVQPMGRH